MYRVELPYTTRTTGVDALDTDNLFRQREIDASASFLNKDDGTFHKVLDMWSTKEPVNQPVYFWVEDDMLPIHTNVNYSAGYAANATSIVVDDAKLCVANSELHVPRTLENIRVTAVDYTTNTLTVVRGWNGSPAAALVNDDVLIAGIPHLAEMADANLGTGRVPGEEMYNYVSRFSESFKISHMQEVAAMVNTPDGRVASIPYEVAHKMFEMKRKVNKALLFQHRGTTSTSDGTIYCSQGFIHYLSQNIYNVNANNENLSWPLISAYLDETFDPSASSREKAVIAGNYLFGAFNRFRRDMSVPAESYYDPNVGTDMIRITTEQGNSVVVMRDRHGFPAAEGLAGWGIVVDLAHVFKREYVGEPMTWRQNIQHGSAHFRQDEYWGSFSLELRHPEVHGLIRGGAAPIVE